MILEILCVEPINPQYSGVLETCLALVYWSFEVLGSESVNVEYRFQDAKNNLSNELKSKQFHIFL